MQYNAKVDTNQAEIVEELRARGFVVVDVHACAPFDLVVIGWYSVFLVEVKSEKGRLTKRESAFREMLNAAGMGSVYLIATSADDVLELFEI
jgi:hypothetical protein